LFSPLRENSRLRPRDSSKWVSIPLKSSLVTKRPETRPSSFLKDLPHIILITPEMLTTSPPRSSQLSHLSNLAWKTSFPSLSPRLRFTPCLTTCTNSTSIMFASRKFSEEESTSLRLSTEWLSSADPRHPSAMSKKQRSPCSTPTSKCSKERPRVQCC